MTARDLSEIAMTTVEHIGAASVAHVEIPKDNPAIALANDVLKRLKVIKPAWSQVIKSAADEGAWKRELVTAMVEARITMQAQVDHALMTARHDPSPWFPSVGQFIAWCNGVTEVDEAASDAYQRFVRRDEPADDVEYNTRLEVGYTCRVQLPAKQARELFTRTYQRYAQKAKRGEHIASRDTTLLSNPNTAPSARESIDNEVDARIADNGTHQHPLQQRLMNIRKGAAHVG